MRTPALIAEITSFVGTISRYQQTMELTFFTEIEGVGAASGIHYQDDFLYLIGDTSAYLYQYELKTSQLKRIQLLDDVQGGLLENIIKNNKPDFETLCYYENTLTILGSGSTAKRNRMVTYSLSTYEKVEEDLSAFYASLRKHAAIDEENFNIEGAVFTGKEWWLFNRGNGNLTKNGIFKIANRTLDPMASLAFIPIELPKIKNVIASFTDAVRVGENIFFLAAAEDTRSTYEDGEVLGSFVGCIDMASFEVTFTQQISDHHKFEGITFYREDPQGISFLLCEDKDSEEMSSSIYKLSLSKIS